MLSFALKPEKLASAIAFLVELRPGLTKKQICKLMYYADKEHLLRYGRPITGDTYFALEQGPIPTCGLDAMNGRGPASEALERYGKLDGWIFRAHRGADRKALSKTDISVLTEISDKLGRFPAWELERLSHTEPAWKSAPQNGPMDFERFFDGRPDADLVKSVLVEDQEPETARTR